MRIQQVNKTYLKPGIYGIFSDLSLLETVEYVQDDTGKFYDHFITKHGHLTLTGLKEVYTDLELIHSEQITYIY